jgi:hypothetical protein
MSISARGAEARPQSPTKRKALGGSWSNFFVNTGVLAATVAITVAVTELAAGDWFEPFVTPLVVVVNRTYTYHQNLYEPHGDIVYARDRYGLRGVHEQLDQIELVTVGGSTTNEIYITEGKTWSDNLRALTGIRVANAGGDGMSSFGHLVAVSEWLHRIPGFRPKFYLHYIGINDAEVGRAPRGSDLSGTQNPWLLAIRKRSAIAKTFERLWFFLHGPRRVQHGGVLPPADKNMVRVDLDSGEIASLIETVYKPNVRKLLALHRERGETAILMSQSVNPALVQWSTEGTFVADSFASGGHFALSLRLINAATADVCGANPDVCRFLDLPGNVRFEPTDFYDMPHTTPAGDRKIAAFLAQQLAFLRDGPDATKARP